jgi:hypothetical protein
VKSFLFTIICCFTISTFSQCPIGDYDITNQAEANAFLIDYPNCEVINGNLNISGHTTIDLSSLNNLTTITGDLVISGTNITTTFNLNNLMSVGGSVKLLFNLQIINLNGFQNLETIGLDFWLEGNDNMLNFNGIGSLTSIGRDFQIDYNALLNSFNGLNNLTNINDRLIIYGNNSLTDLTNLNSLVSVTNGILLNNNPILTSLNGLNNIDSSTFSILNLFNMNNLTDCAYTNLCTYLDNGGTSNIFSNAFGCNSSEQIISACNALSLNDISNSTKITIYPNPASHYIYINSDKYLSAKVYDIRGLLLIEGKINKEGLEIGTLNPGIYLLKIQNKKSFIFIKN